MNYKNIEEYVTVAKLLGKYSIKSKNINIRVWRLNFDFIYNSILILYLKLTKIKL